MSAEQEEHPGNGAADIAAFRCDKKDPDRHPETDVGKGLHLSLSEK